MHLTALALSIALLIFAGSIWATSLEMLACTWFRVAGRGRPRAVDLGLQEASEAEVEWGEVGGAMFMAIASKNIRQ